MFSIFDKDSGCYLHTGRNSETREECVQDGINFMYEDEDEEIYNDVNKSSIDSKEIILNTAGYVVEEHTDLITDYWEMSEKDDDFGEMDTEFD